MKRSSNSCSSRRGEGRGEEGGGASYLPGGASIRQSSPRPSTAGMRPRRVRRVRTRTGTDGI